jgi:predicted HD superfamily hydrolase involved in NAD metabolism
VAPGGLGGAVMTPPRSDIELPRWAKVTDKRRAHIARVTAQLMEWAQALRLGDDESARWRDAGLLHDALRDADETELRTLAGEPTALAEMLHGPAAAAMLRREGERREDVLQAISYHTIGHANFERTGRALYMADFLEPGRSFAGADRAYLRRHVPRDFDATFRQVVKMRIEWTLREGKALFPETVEMWNAVR